MGDAPASHGKIRENAEFRLDHYRVYDEDGFLSSLAVAAPLNATVNSARAGLCERSHGSPGTGYESKDVVVLLVLRSVAVVRQGAAGEPEMTRFGASLGPSINRGRPIETRLDSSIRCSS